MNKICTKCNQDKDLSEFYTYTYSHKDKNEIRTKTICKKCINEKCKIYYKKHYKEYYESNKDKINKKCQIYNQNNKNNINQTRKKYYLKTKSKILKRQKLYYQNNKLKMREKAIKRHYKISLEDYNNLLNQQNNRCKICNREFTGINPMVPNIDHDHKTGKVRGILCSKHNIALGGFEDNIEFLKNAINYLNMENHNE